MSLIERYIHEVGRHLPVKNRADIQVELRSSLEDALESKMDGKTSEADVVTMLKAFGSPRDVAASYFPEGQYLIGPTLYPLFRMIVGIVLAAIIGSNLIAWSVSYFISQEPFAPAQAAMSLLNSIPAALGMVVIVFMILQWLEIRPEMKESEWDPHDLPQLDEIEEVKRNERIFSIIMAIFFLIVLVFFPEKIGFVSTLGGEFFINPIISQYTIWISLSFLFGIGLDIYLLRQGRWNVTGRLLKVAANVFSIVILFLLVKGHSAWLDDRGSSSFFNSIAQLPKDIVGGSQLVGMQAFRLAFAIALIVITIETLVMLGRLVIRLTIGSMKREPVVFQLKK